MLPTTLAESWVPRGCEKSDPRTAIQYFAGPPNREKFLVAMRELLQNGGAYVSPLVCLAEETYGYLERFASGEVELRTGRSRREAVGPPRIVVGTYGCLREEDYCEKLLIVDEVTLMPLERAISPGKTITSLLEDFRAAGVAPQSIILISDNEDHLQALQKCAGNRILVRLFPYSTHRPQGSHREGLDCEGLGCNRPSKHLEKVQKKRHTDGAAQCLVCRHDLILYEEVLQDYAIHVSCLCEIFRYCVDCPTFPVSTSHEIWNSSCDGQRRSLIEAFETKRDTAVKTLTIGVADLGQASRNLWRRRSLV